MPFSLFNTHHGRVAQVSELMGLCLVRYVIITKSHVYAATEKRARIAPNMENTSPFFLLLHGDRPWKDNPKRKKKEVKKEQKKKVTRNVLRYPNAV